MAQYGPHIWGSLYNVNTLTVSLLTQMNKRALVKLGLGLWTEVTSIGAVLIFFRTCSQYIATI